jgi:hypothetical protein
MTHQERWPSDRRSEEYGQRQRSYGEPEWRGPGLSSQRFEPRYEAEEHGMRGARRDEPWEASRGGYGSSYGGREEERERGFGQRFGQEEYRRSPQAERWGSDEARERGYGYGYGSSGYEPARSGPASQRTAGWSEGGWGRQEPMPRYGDTYGGSQSWYGDSGRGAQHHYGDRGSFEPSRGSEQAWQRAPEGPGSWHGMGRQGFGGALYGPGGSPEARSEGSSPGMARPSWGSTPYSSSWGEGRSSLERSGPSSRESYRGKGPKNYRRSDERIHEEICERLSLHGDLDASDIEVQVKGGTVTLTGEVSERAAKRMAEDAIDDISGVTDVNNQIRVRQSQGQRSSSSSSSPSSSGGSMEDKSLTPASRSTESSSDSSREKARPTASR